MAKSEQDELEIPKSKHVIRRGVVYKETELVRRGTDGPERYTTTLWWYYWACEVPQCGGRMEYLNKLAMLNGSQIHRGRHTSTAELRKALKELT